MRQPLGAHVSISGGVENAFARGAEIGATAIQIFTKNASQWRAKPISAESAAAFRANREQSTIGPVIAHDSYLINLAAPDDARWQQSKAAFADELERCALLGVTELVMHPGSHLGEGEEAGIARVVAAFKEIIADAPDSVRILVETTAGQGTNLGWRFEHLAQILKELPEERFGVCFDTCHVFAAGYDLSTAEGYAQVMAEFDRIVGIERIACFHLNDCKKPCGSRVDRHDHVGRGAIGEAGFAALMQDARFAAIPKILETPKGENNEDDLRNLALLRRLAGEVEGDA